MEKTKILIVEDEKTIAKSIQSSLITLGYDVCGIVSSGKSAIQSAQDFSPGLILMDIKLKGSMDGIEATRIIQSRFNIPVIYLTAYGDSETIGKLIKTAPYGYIYKPHDEKELHGAIQTALYKHHMDKKLKEKEAWLFTTLKSFGDAVITTDKNGYITFINPVTETITKWKWEEAIGKPLSDVFNVKHETTYENFDYFLNKVLSEGKSINIDDHFNLFNKNNKAIPIDDTCAPIRDDRGNIIGAVIVFKDVTEQKKAKQMLRESESKFRSLAEQSPNMIFIYQDSKLVYINKACKELLGYQREEIYDKKFDFFSIFSKESVKLVKELFDINTKVKMAIPFDCSLIAKNGNVLETIVTTNNILYGGQFAVLGTVVDITVRKKMEEAIRISEERYRLLAENALDGIYIINSSGFEYVNPAFSNFVGYEREELFAKNFNFIDIVHPGDKDLITERLKARENGTKVIPTITFRALTKNRQIKYVEVNSVRLPGEELKILGMVRDITARKFAEEKLKKSLAEKEVLLKEVNHRVKNNLQRILSLLRLQSKNIKDEKVVKILQDSQHRVLSMALIHDQIYQAENLSEINLSEYIRSLAKKLYKTYNAYLLEIVLELKLDSISLDVDKALTCGLIINELVSNAFKHAFPQDFSAKKKLEIGLKNMGNSDIQITIFDNGVGLQKGINLKKIKTLGLDLVVTLVEKQLQGKVIVERDGGTKFMINFKG
ncbi:PAS domain S-box protein [candidate division KSB1 bacterium]|nr:PAS domain S-box protein [candidate division KSB1 bacterium]